MTRIAPSSIVPHHLARSIGIKRLLEHFRWKVRSHARADCGLCGSQHQHRTSAHGTVSFSDSGGLWHCHRCHAGGDVFNLVMAVEKCGFRTALAYVAELCGVQPRSPDARQVAEAERRRKQRQAEAARLIELERCLRRESCARLHDWEADQRDISKLLWKLLTTGTDDAETERLLWSLLQEVNAEIEVELARYTLLSFAAPTERLRYLRANAENRQAMVVAVRGQGYVSSGDGKLISSLMPGAVIYAGVTSDRA